MRSRSTALLLTVEPRRKFGVGMTFLVFVANQKINFRSLLGASLDFTEKSADWTLVQHDSC